MNAHTLLFLILLLPALPAGAAAVKVGPVEAELLAERSALVPGTDNWVALRLKPDPQWHVYWRNPGDSGIATQLEWRLPAGIGAGDIVWPYPQLMRLGDLANYGYGDETLHLVPLTVTVPIGETQTLAATAKWLVCKDVCIPGSAELQLRMPIAASAAPVDRWQALFARTRAAVPTPAPEWAAQFAIDADSLSLAINAAAVEGASDVRFFPYASDLVNHAAAQRLALNGPRLRLSQARSSYLVEAPKRIKGVLVVAHGAAAKAYEFAAAPGSVTAVAASADAAVSSPAPAAEAGAADGAGVPPSLLAALGLALLGGLVLNLMPCVFPILSLKALSMARSGGGNHGRQALAYTAGVIVSCLAAAAAILALQRAGAAVGWGFQLQSPIFVGLMAYALFAFALSLSGLASFGTRLMNLGQGLTEKSGLAGTFFTGVLAVVVASPCTAPFMGAALGYAVTQSAPTALAVFTMLGLGLALPFLVIGFVPAAARLLPRPGGWMEGFKQLMAFPLYLSVVWLVWVLARQLDAGAAAQLMTGLVLIAFVLWLWAARGLVASLGKLGAAALALVLLLTLPAVDAGKATASATTRTARNAEPWSAQRVSELRREGRTVFVDFTADWCLSCKVNEHVALRSARVVQALHERNVAMLVADWTRADPAITAELAHFGRNGVPLYLVYRDGGEPTILPQLLTPALVAAALQ